MNAESTVAGDAPKSKSRLPRLVEWFWQGQALAAARATAQEQRIVHVQWQRARIAAEVAERILNPSGPWRAGDASHLAAGLCVESVGWSLRILDSRAEQRAADEAPTDTKPPTHGELKRLASTHRDLLGRAAGDPDTLARLTRHLLDRDFEAAPVVASDIEHMARELSKVAVRLLELTGPGKSRVDELTWQRAWRLVALGAVLVTSWVALASGRDWLERRRDLSAGRPWQQSSSYEQVCVSPLRRCGQTKDYFFHTQEEASPWLEVDLTQARNFSAVHVLNRGDCCAERAVPLLVEVSTDHQVWREVVRRNEIFDSWRPNFKPVTARWVRFRVARRTILHLRDVRVLP